MKEPIIVPREIFKVDPVFMKLYQLIKDKHKVPEHTKRTLLQSMGIKNFCETSRVFAALGEMAYIHYDVSTWLDKGKYKCRFDSIGIYDDQMHYEIARLKGLHSTKDSDIPNIN